ncbi:MAG: hypothetical protein LBQ65_07555 [Tannerellaceae bacterium]|jgi:hypothetical protein|nr:hypothetical protein [Tannerellaceae bacterium]
MEERELNILSENASWSYNYAFVSREGVATKNIGTMSFKIHPGHIIQKWWFIDDYGDEVSFLNDIKQIDEHNYEYESNELAGVVPMKGTMYAERNRLYRQFSMGDTPLNGFEIIIRKGDKCEIYGIIYFENKMIKSWNGVLEKM